MKLLLDNNLSPRLIGRLNDLYPDSGHVHWLGLGRENDLGVWDYARQQGYIIVTKDADFSDLSAIWGIPPKVVWIRRGNCTTSQIEAILRQHYPAIKNLAEEAELSVLILF